MHFNDLPDDVLALVFQAAQPAIKRDLADVSSGLGLLSVCRRWREVALPMVHDTVVLKYDTKGADVQESLDIKTTLDLVVDAKCLRMVRKVVIDVCYQINTFQELKPVIERMRSSAGEWAGVRKLELILRGSGSGDRELHLPAAIHKNEIASVSSALAALMPGLREIKFEDFPQAPIIGVLFGRLAGFYADQLQVLHSSNPLIVPQEHVFARLRDVKIKVSLSGSLEGKLPRLDPEVVESLVLSGLTANEMWSMFCADSNQCAITFPRLTNLDLGYRLRAMMDSERRPTERPWALQFPAAKRVRISCFDEECPSMENAVFPDRLESLDLSACLSRLSVFARRKVEISRNLSIYVTPVSDVNNRRIDITTRMLEAADSCRSKKLVIGRVDAILLEHITYTRLTHLHLSGLTKADDVIQFIRRQQHLVSLRVGCLNMAGAQTDFSIPECAEHEPVAPLDTQIKLLAIEYAQLGVSQEPALSMLKYLLLRISTLKSVSMKIVLAEQIQTFIDEYVQWYPHLANIKFVVTADAPSSTR